MCYMIVPLRELRARERISIRMVLGCKSVSVLRIGMNVCTNFKAYIRTQLSAGFQISQRGPNPITYRPSLVVVLYPGTNEPAAAPPCPAASRSERLGAELAIAWSMPHGHGIITSCGKKVYK